MYMQCTLKRVKPRESLNSYAMTLRGATRGTVLAILTALNKHATPCAIEAAEALAQAVVESGDVPLQDATREAIQETERVRSAVP